MGIRSFIALSISELLEESLAEISDQCQQQLIIPTIRWVPAENYHITLAFLDTIHPQQLAEIAECLDDLALAFDRFELQVDSLQWFPSIHKPKYLVAAIRPQPILMALQQQCLQRLRRMGFNLPRQRYRPHITLARMPRDRYPLQLLQPLTIDFTVPAMDADELVLFESHLLPSGSHYTPLHVALLANSEVKDLP